MTVDSIQNGIVIDHIAAGRGMKLYDLLKLNKTETPVAMMMNVTSGKLGRKDMIKIDGEITLNLDVIGYVDPGATVNVIQDGKLKEKRRIEMPERLENVIRCKNPRCISTTEQELSQIFLLTDREQKEYRCLWCETRAAKI
ncbi:MAG: aspartate carbamoyltransferase regulatory subunit [Clostridia bacterium]|nr:aspartate carbamoyltransferase regulatory subunit [Clostridia bacterium]